MADKHAYRDLKICSKDCLCLFVCPTGATNTETGQIDFEKCIGCGACALACPAKAISLLPNKMPVEQSKDDRVVAQLAILVKSKIDQMRTLKYLLNNSKDEAEVRLIKALLQANKVMVEDLLRESRYMLPQSNYSREFLTNLLEENDRVNKEKIEILLNNIEWND